MKIIFTHASKSGYFAGLAFLIVLIGAINSATLAMFDYGQEKEAVNFLEELYLSRQPKDFFKFWPSIIFPPLWKSSIVDN